MFLLSKEWTKSPRLFLADQAQFKYLVQEKGFLEFELLGHVFGIATVQNWEIEFGHYINTSIKAKEQFFRDWKNVKRLDEIDLTLSIMDVSME